MIKLTDKPTTTKYHLGVMGYKRLRKYGFLIQVVHGSMEWPMGWNKIPRIKSRVPGQFVFLFAISV